jgi:hypothetical protein
MQQPSNEAVTYSYLVVHCKTPGCKMMHALKYLGPKGVDRGEIPIAVPAPFVIDCPRCKNPYNFRMEDIRQAELPYPAPPDFQDKI